MLLLLVPYNLVIFCVESFIKYNRQVIKYNDLQNALLWPCFVWAITGHYSRSVPMVIQVLSDKSKATAYKYSIYISSTLTQSKHVLLYLGYTSAMYRSITVVLIMSFILRIINYRWAEKLRIMVYVNYNYGRKVSFIGMNIKHVLVVILIHVVLFGCK